MVVALLVLALALTLALGVLAPIVVGRIRRRNFWLRFSLPVRIKKIALGQSGLKLSILVWS